jgi:hypothetical protein
MPNICKALRDAFFGQHREAVLAAVPDLPPEAFGAHDANLLMPFAERAGLIPEGEVRPPPGSTHLKFRIGNGERPGQGYSMDRLDPIPTPIDLGRRTLKQDVLATCLILGARYGCCWFAGFHNDAKTHASL